jgi:hypothetical protein
MTERAALELDTLTIRIPIRLQRRGGRKLIMTPEGVTAPARKPSRDETLVRRSSARTAGGGRSRADRRSRSPISPSKKA